MTFKKNDLAVFQFLRVLTKCKTGAAAFTQLDAQGKKRTANMCNTEQGVVFDFEDKKAQRELERMMTPSARAAVRQILGVTDMVRAKEGAALLQAEAKSAEPEDEEGDDSADDHDTMAVERCVEPVGGYAALPAGARRDQLQRVDQRLREGPAVGAGLELVACDVALLAGARRYQLQRGDQRLREGPAVGAGLELVTDSVAILAGARRDQLQRGDQRVREGQAVGAGLELVAQGVALST